MTNAYIILVVNPEGKMHRPKRLDNNKLILNNYNIGCGQGSSISGYAGALKLGTQPTGFIMKGGGFLNYLTSYHLQNDSDHRCS
jgi:hypothetical protein